MKLMYGRLGISERFKFRLRAFARYSHLSSIEIDDTATGDLPRFQVFDGFWQLAQRVDLCDWLEEAL